MNILRDGGREPAVFLFDAVSTFEHSAAGLEDAMPLIDTGETQFVIEEGLSHAGWTLKALEHATPGAKLGAYWYTFVRGECEVRLSNRFWPSDKMTCLTNMMPAECPPELRIFGSHQTKVMQEG